MRLVLCIVAVEAITQLICKAEIFNRLRNYIQSLSKFTNELLECPYCVSVWVAVFITVLYYFWEYSCYFVIMLVVHRISNWLHDSSRIITNYKIDQIMRRK
jgi:uncharacterized membrane protein